MPKFCSKPIFTGLSPNAERDDALLAARLLFLPWKWRKGFAREQLEIAFKKLLCVKYAFALESGRTSLMVALKAAGISEGDEVLLQAFTCVAVPNAVRWVGGRAVFVDCDPESFTMNPDDLEKKITPRSRAVILQHTFGNPGELDCLVAIARNRNLVIIEDCAHTIGGEYQGKRLGTIGDMAIFSFGRDKAISSVFGGVLVTKSDSSAEKIRALYAAAAEANRVWIKRQLLHPIICSMIIATFSCGVGKAMLFAAKKSGLLSLAVLALEREGKKPAFVGKRMPNALCLLALHQLSKLDRYNAHRRALAEKYRAAFSNLHYTLHVTRYKSEVVPLRFSLMVNDPDALLLAAKRENIYLGDWYRQPVAPSRVSYATIGYAAGSCPNAELIAKRIVNLPLDIHIMDTDADRIIATVARALR